MPCDTHRQHVYMCIAINCIHFLSMDPVSMTMLVNYLSSLSAVLYFVLTNSELFWDEFEDDDDDGENFFPMLNYLCTTVLYLSRVLEIYDTPIHRLLAQCGNYQNL